MKAYYGFKVKGKVLEFLEQFKSFQYIPDVQNTGFLGVEISSTEYVTKTIDFPKMLETYSLINSNTVVENKKLTEELIAYQKQEKEPVIFVPLEFKNKFFKTWSDYESFTLGSKKSNTNVI